MESKKYEEIHFVETNQAVWNYSLFSKNDIIDFQAGLHCFLYKLFGNKQISVLNTLGTYFAVWAPNAKAVYVKGNFNNWSNESHPLKVRLDSSGIWEGFIPNLLRGELYKYHIINIENISLDKGDPYCHLWELKPNTASITWDTFYDWADSRWMKDRKIKNKLNRPFSVYEVHLASWKKPVKDEEESYYSYQYFADDLVKYVQEMGFTHVELMPIMEFPFDGSWGYQGVGYFAPTSRFGSPQDFAFLINAFHQAGIGVILDWVPSHFPYDAHGLYLFDGTHTYEYADMRKGYHPDWNSYIFNYSRGEVKSFLLSSAHFWCEIFHIDGLRVDAVSSILKLDYSRKIGQWEPNIYGGNGNLEAIQFIKDLNLNLYKNFPDIQTIAEESTDWPNVCKPIYLGGLGFGMKWMMGWMHDTLDYFKLDPLLRPYQQNKFTFSMMYYYDENFMLPLSHDEVVHGKSPMIYKMPGDDWQKFANLRLLYLYMFTHPGGKLLFMGNEFGDTLEWNYKSELQWHLLEFGSHKGLQLCVRDLNNMLKKEPALYALQFDTIGFEWLDLNHRLEGIISYKRKSSIPQEELLIILNLTPVNRQDYTLIVNEPAEYEVILNSDAIRYWGVGQIQNEIIKTEPINPNEKDTKYYLKIQLAALSGMIIKVRKKKLRIKN